MTVPSSVSGRAETAGERLQAGSPRAVGVSLKWSNQTIESTMITGGTAFALRLEVSLPVEFPEFAELTHAR